MCGPAAQENRPSLRKSEVSDMQIMGTNRWERDIPEDRLVKEALRFADAVKAQGIAQLRDACIATDQKLLWCTWDTEDLGALEAAFADLNERSGLISELTPVEAFYPEPAR
jgi:hypothetical protein